MTSVLDTKTILKIHLFPTIKLDYIYKLYFHLLNVNYKLYFHLLNVNIIQHNCGKLINFNNYFIVAYLMLSVPRNECANKLNN